MCDVVSKLTNLLDERNVLTEERMRERHPGLYPENLNAKALITPHTVEQVSASMRLCHEAGQPVVTHGGLTGATRATVTTPDEIILSVERLNKIETLDPIGRTMTVQAGAILQTVQERAEDEGLIFALDLGARGSCMIGGNIATNAGGNQVIRYGMTRDLVLGLEVVLADGTLISSMNILLKNNSGYDLKQLFIGSEGTLGIITRAVLRLSERPREKRTALVATDHFDKLLKLFLLCRERLGARLGSFEVMWREYFSMATSAKSASPPMSTEHPCYAIIEVLCMDETDSAALENSLETAFENQLLVDAVIPKSEAERDAIWEIRDSFLTIVERYPEFVDMDTCVPIKEMENYLQATLAKLKDRFPELAVLAHGHLGDGNVHTIVAGEKIDSEKRRAVEMIFYEPLRTIGGTVSAEHGIGLERREFLHLCRTENEMALMRTLKSALDPKGILNPGKVFCPQG